MGNNYDNIILVIQFKIIIDFLVGSGTYRKKIKVWLKYTQLVNNRKAQ